MLFEQVENGELKATKLQDEDTVSMSKETWSLSYWRDKKRLYRLSPGRIYTTEHNIGDELCFDEVDFSVASKMVARLVGDFENIFLIHKEESDFSVTFECRPWGRQGTPTRKD